MKVPNIIKKNPMQVFCILYFIASAIIIWRLVVNLRSGVNKTVTQYVDRIVKDTQGGTHLQKPFDYDDIKSKNAELEKESDSFNKLMGIKDAQIVSLTKFSGNLSDSIKLKNVAITEANTKAWYWEKTYKSGSKIVATMDEKDSILVPRADLKLSVKDVVEGKGRDARYYTDISTPDDNITFNGSKVIRTERKQPKKIYSLNLKSDLYFDGTRPFLYKPEIELQILPDGRIIPKVGAGALIDFDNKSRMFWKIGVDIPIKSSSK